MKRFLWRLKSNVLPFIVVMAAFAGVYVWWVKFNIRVMNVSGVDQIHLNVLSGISPHVISYICCLVFFFLYTKRYTYHEDCFLGGSRTESYLASLSCALVYASIFTFYALGAAVLARYVVLNRPDMIVPDVLYHISGKELFYNWLLLLIVNLLAYESANLLRQFKSWKFWVNFLVCGAVIITAVIMFTMIPYDKFDYWRDMFIVFAPYLGLLFAGDYLMTRGTERR